MAKGKRVASRGSASTTVLEEERSPKTKPAEEHPVDRLFERVEPAPVSVPEGSMQREPASGLRTARIAEVSSSNVKIMLRGQRTPVAAELGEGVERELIAQAKRNRDIALVEVEPGMTPVIVGVVQTRFPRDVTIKAERVTIEGEREVLLRSGRAAVRLREDGDVELVGSRILAMSRGLFRIVGRILRLN